MNKTSSEPSSTPSGKRLGFHYFADTLHYRLSDLNTWLPRLRDLGAAWIVLRSETGRAIPEAFLAGLVAAGIEPVIHFHSPQADKNGQFDLAGLKPLLEVYARWGARYAIFFDRPNLRGSVQAHNWVQQDPVKAFLDRFLPAANLAVQCGLQPVFPPLEPGGGYWDTAFLRASLVEMQRRKEDAVLGKLAISACGWTWGHALAWGAGGPDQWPQARPYETSPNVQDHRGFHIYEWYDAVAKSVLNRSLPIFLLQAGSSADPEHGSIEDAAVRSEQCLEIAQMLAKPEGEGGVPASLTACCFYTLAAEKGSPTEPHAFYVINTGKTGLVDESPVAIILRGWLPKPQPGAKKSGKAPIKPIRHYLLLPGFEWGVSDWYLEVARPFVKKYRPTIGFSVDEAQLAEQVTVVGNVPGFTPELMSRLSENGCEIEWIDGDGTTIATQLSER